MCPNWDPLGPIGTQWDPLGPIGIHLIFAHILSSMKTFVQNKAWNLLGPIQINQKPLGPIWTRWDPQKSIEF